MTDSEGKVIYINPAYEERTGLKGADLLGRTIYDLQKTNVIQCDIIPHMLKTGEPANEIGYVVPTNYRGFIAGIPIKDEKGSIRYAMTTDWDVSTILELENRLTSLQKGKIDNEENSTETMILSDDDIWYVSDVMRELMELTKLIAQTDVTVLITGETGTGKELFASAIVKNSKRANKPFVKINCAAIPPNLLESELFGYEEGSFTGAKKGGKAGAFEEANGGTILLDEIGELPFQVQAKLLRVLQENEVLRVGGVKPIPLNIKVIAATNRDLVSEIKEGRFREDLYYRLNIMPIEIPALRHRPEDALFLANRFLAVFNEKYNKTLEMDGSAIRILKRYAWPGNVRELKNLMERLVIICRDGIISDKDVEKIIKVKTEDISFKDGENLKQALERIEKSMIEEAVYTYKNKTQAAEALGVERTTFLKKCQKYGIE